MDAKQIQEVTAEGLRYLDDDGVEQYIDFEACYQNYFRRRTSAKNWEEFKQLNNLTDADWEAHLESLKKWKEIGARNATPYDGGPFIQFYTEPPIRFVFESPHEVERVRRIARNGGWNTFDLT